MALNDLNLQSNSSFLTNCFPVRPLHRFSEDGEGAWLVAHKAEQKKNFNAIICSNAKTFEKIKQDRINKDRLEQGKSPFPADVIDTEDGVLDGFFLLRKHHANDPNDICVVNINGCSLSSYKSDDFSLFDNVVHINAAENLLPLEAFNGFSSLQELELPLNGLRNVTLKPGDFPNLEFLDLSYNNLSINDIFSVGLLPRLKRLHLSGNGLTDLPDDIAQPEILDDGSVLPRFSQIEVLMLDDNQLCNPNVFSNLAGLPRLTVLNLERNGIASVPFLRSVAGKVVTIDNSSTPGLSRDRHTKSRSRKSSSGRPHRQKSVLSENALEVKNSDVEALTKELLDNVAKASTLSRQASARSTDTADANVDNVKAKLLELNRPDSAPIVTIDKNYTLDSLRSIDDLREHSGTLPSPFPSLRSLNLANNLIATDEALIPVSLWPLLCELIIYNNPLTNKISGEPPLLRRLLREHLGIDIIRKKPSIKPKPPIYVDNSRQVNIRVLPVPRCNVDELLLAITAPSPHPSEEFRAQSQPLPPIVMEPTTTEHTSLSKDNEEETFFMTQVDDLYQNNPQLVSTEIPERISILPNSQYEEYAELFLSDDWESTVNVTPSQDITGNVKSLEYLLNHTLTFNTRSIKLSEKQPTIKPRKKETLAPLVHGFSRQEKINNALSSVRNGQSYLEVPLTQVLKKVDETSINRTLVNRGEANDLMSDIQRKYNVVRSTSMNFAKDLMRENMQVMVTDIKNQIHKNLQSQGIVNINEKV